LLNWPSLSVQIIVGVGAAYLTYRHLILTRRPLFPDVASIGNQLWLVVASFLYATFNSVRTSLEPNARRKARYLRSRFTALREQYEALIKDQFPQRYMELVAYAILIHETFNRPWVNDVTYRLLGGCNAEFLHPSAAARFADIDVAFGIDR
jgi:hypothetical protein